MANLYSRDYESKLLDKIREYGVTDEDLVSCFLAYFSSDDTCEFLEDVCNTYEIDF